MLPTLHWPQQPALIQMGLDARRCTSVTVAHMIRPSEFGLIPIKRIEIPEAKKGNAFVRKLWTMLSSTTTKTGGIRRFGNPQLLKTRPSQIGAKQHRLPFAALVSLTSRPPYLALGL